MAHKFNTIETAAAMRKALRGAFPGSRISVRRGTGTASSWIDVSWTDGPTDAAVRQIVKRFQSADWNGMTDSYDQRGATLAVVEPGAAPEPVEYSCVGTTTSRNYSVAAWAEAARLIRSVAPDLEVLDHKGWPRTDYQPLDAITIAGLHHSSVGSMRQLAERVLATTDLCGVAALSRL